MRAKAGARITAMRAQTGARITGRRHEPWSCRDMNLPVDAPRQEALGDALVRIARKYAAQQAQDLDALAIGPTQLRILELVNAEPGLCMTVVAEQLAIDKAAVTRAVARLIRNGFVERVRCRRDRRLWELGATRLGRVALRVAASDCTSPAGRLVAGFSEDDLRQLRAHLHHLDANLDVSATVFVRRMTRGSDHALSWVDEPA